MYLRGRSPHRLIGKGVSEMPVGVVGVPVAPAAVVKLPKLAMLARCVRVDKKESAVRLMESDALHDCMRMVYSYFFVFGSKSEGKYPEGSYLIESLEELPFEVNQMYKLGVE